MPIKRFWNVSGLQYRVLDMKNKLPTMDYEEQLKLLCTDGMLIKRPLLIADDVVMVGFKESQWEEKLLK